MKNQLLQLWESALPLIEEEVTPVGFNTWIKTIVPMAVEGKTIILSVPSIINKNMIEHRYSDLIKNALFEITNAYYEITVSIGDKEAKSEATPVKVSETCGQPLNPKYRFESFVVGNSNRFAHAASLAVAEAPAMTYNPLFLYGGVGLGKTHLLHAIGNYIKENNSELKVMYVSSETFTTDLINSIKDSRNEEFRNKYRFIDVLMVDDIQFIAGKKVTEEEFFHTFNALYDANKQIIITSDRPPKEIRTLEERLRNRFEWGIIGDIYSPDYETRVAILKKKAQLEGIEINDDILMLISEKITSNVRELEGVFNRVIAYRGLISGDITMDVALDAMKNYESGGIDSISPEIIVDACAKYYNLRKEDIMSNKRTKDIAKVRQIVMYLLRELMGMSQPKIGKFLDKHHSTVIYGINEVESELENDVSLKFEIDTLIKDIKG